MRYFHVTSQGAHVLNPQYKNYEHRLEITGRLINKFVVHRTKRQHAQFPGNIIKRNTYRYWLRSHMHHWLDQNIGRYIEDESGYPIGGWGLSLAQINGHCVRKHMVAKPRIVFYFQSQADVLAFKLTWS